MRSDAASTLEGDIQLWSNSSHSDDDDESPFIGAAPFRLRKFRMARARLTLHGWCTCSLAVTVAILLFYVVFMPQNQLSVHRMFEYIPVRSGGSPFKDSSVPLPEIIANDLTMDAATCDVLFPDLYESIESAVDWFQNRGGISKEEYETTARSIGHGNSRVAIRNNRVYASALFFVFFPKIGLTAMYQVKQFNGGWMKRMEAQLASLNRAVTSSPEPLPGLSYCNSTGSGT
jgi:hypothetical protein